MPSISIGNETFTTQTALMRHAKSLRDSIGKTSSVNSVNENYTQFFYELLQRHPEAEKKLENFTDFEICSPAIGSGLEMRVVRSDGFKSVSFSLPTCCSGKSSSLKFKLNQAMRSAVVNQIKDFKLWNEKTVCPRITSNCTGHADEVDHENYFEKLVYDFLKMNLAPTSFDKRTGTNQHCFLPENRDFEDKWKVYHHQNAVLRYLCGACNKTRPKWKGHII